MRKLNAIVVIGMFIFLLLHMIFGILLLTGVSDMPMVWISYTLLGFVILHAIISTILTIQSIITMKKTHTLYFKENKLFWLRRISGFLIIIAIVFHLVIFLNLGSDSVRLKEFNVFSLISQIFLVIFIAIHVISNVKPTLISFGITSLKEFSVDILIVISIVLFIALVAFFIYFFRWQG